MEPFKRAPREWGIDIGLLGVVSCEDNEKKAFLAPPAGFSWGLGKTRDFPSVALFCVAGFFVFNALSMMEYEILYLVGESKKAQLETIKKGVEAAIVASGGDVKEGEFVDERRMEYSIKGELRGTYIAKRFTVKESAGDIPAEVTKKISFDKNILRFMVVRAEELPTLEESQERVRRVSDVRRKPQGRSSSSRPRSFQETPAPAPKPASTTPALSDTEIDKKLGEVLDI